MENMQQGTGNNRSLIQQIKKIKQEKNALILAHYYQSDEIQEIADFVGDSLGLSQQAADTDADVIVFCGVHFMAESAAILCPDKIVLLPEPTAGCPMADMAGGEALRKMKAQYPKAAVVCYINSSAEVKAESDICCTSANALKVVQSLTDYEQVIFVPDRNLGHYVSCFTEKEIILWEGFCPTHDQLKPEEIAAAKRQYPEAPILVHPEAPPSVVDMTDHVFSTSGMLKYVKETNDTNYIIVTEKGIKYQLEKDNPGKHFWFPSERLICRDMKLITLQKVFNALETLSPRITVSNDIRMKAIRALDRMLAVGRERKN